MLTVVKYFCRRLRRSWRSKHRSDLLDVRFQDGPSRRFHHFAWQSRMQKHQSRLRFTRRMQTTLDRRSLLEIQRKYTKFQNLGSYFAKIIFDFFF